MNTTQLEFTARAGGQSQCDRILERLQKSAGQWVSIVELHRVSGSYVIHSRIADLRKRGCQIEQRNEWSDGQCHSFYRLNFLDRINRIDSIEAANEGNSSPVDPVNPVRN